MLTSTLKERRVSRETALKKVELDLAAGQEDLRLRFERARLLIELGRHNDAKHAYLDILTKEPTHFVALNNIGTLLHKTDCRKAARAAYAEAVKCHPDKPMGHLNLANVLSEDGELALARAHYETALRLAPDNFKAHQGLAHLLMKMGDQKASRVHQRLGFKGHAVQATPFYGQGDPIRLLVLVSAEGGNVRIQRFLDYTIFLTTQIVTDFYEPSEPVPPHDLVINAIGDADLCAPALAGAKRILAQTTAPVINHPSAVEATGREANASRLAAIPHVRLPKITFLSRTELAGAGGASLLREHGYTYPLLLRTPGYHQGMHFEKVDRPEDLATVVAGLPGDEIAVIQYLDARSADGKIRKYRVMMIDGKFYPLHAAISRQWKIHYFSAEMADNADHRAEDAAFLENMPQVLGPRAMEALRQIHAVLGLDYAGIDFSLDAEGRILLFEANATMAVVPPKPLPIWAYRNAYVQRINDAVRDLLLTKARCTP